MIRSAISRALRPANKGAHVAPGQSLSPQDASTTVDLRKYTSVSAACSINGSNGMLYANAGVLNASYLFKAPTSKSYSVSIYGSDSQAGTTGTIYIDGISGGTFTFPNGGSAAVGGSVASAAVAVPITISAGVHTLRISYNSPGTKPGLKQAVFA